jgi:hypothetical protein
MGCLKTCFVIVAVVAAATRPAHGQEPPATQPTPVAAPPSSQTANYFNPSISVIGNFIAVGGTNEVEDRPSLSLEESEIGLQADVDPYARADFFISFSEEEPPAPNLA